MDTPKIKIFVGEVKLDQNQLKEAENAKNGVTFKTVEAVQDMILLSNYIDVIRQTFDIPSLEESEYTPLKPLNRNKLRSLILNNLPLMYTGI